VEHGTTSREVILPLSDKSGDSSVYFSLILVPPQSVTANGDQRATRVAHEGEPCPQS
jgi:hypothetical protein